MLTEIHVPTLDGWGYAYQKFNRRSEDWAMVAVSAFVKQTGDVCEDVRIGLTNMGSAPLRATAVEEALHGPAAERRDDRQGSRAGRRGDRPAGGSQRERASTSATSRGCCAGGRSRRRPGYT